MINFLVKHKKATKMIFLLSVVFMFIMSASLMMAYPASEKAFENNDKTPLAIDGAVFWGSFILAYICFITVSLVRRKDVGKSQKSLPGILKFFSNPIAKIADFGIIIFIVALIVCAFLTDSFITFIFLFLTVFFVQMHGVFNGKNYVYIKSLKKSEGK